MAAQPAVPAITAHIETPIGPALPPNAAVKVLIGEDNLPILVLEGFLTSDECAGLVEELGPQLPITDVNASGGRRRQQADVLNADLNAALWSRLRFAASESPELNARLNH